MKDIVGYQRTIKDLESTIEALRQDVRDSRAAEKLAAGAIKYQQDKAQTLYGMIRRLLKWLKVYVSHNGIYTIGHGPSEEDANDAVSAAEELLGD